MEQTEARIQQECFMWHWNTKIEERGRLLLMYNNPRNVIAGALLKGMGLRAGVADLLYLRQVQKGTGGLSGVLIDGWYTKLEALVQPHFLECKTGTGRQSKEQKKFEKEVLAFGWRYDVFRNLEEFKNLINGEIN